MLAIAYAVSGSAYDFYAFDAAGLVYNGSAWVAWDDADFADYRIPAAESGTSGRFAATLPDDTARYALRFRGSDLTGSYLVWEDAVASGGLTPTQATQLAETHAKAMLIGDYPQILVDRDPAIGERFSIHKGADYKSTLSNALRIVDVGGLVLPAATTQVKIEIGHRIHHDQFATIDGAVEADGSDLVAVFDVLATDTAGLSPGPCDYSIYELVDSQWRRLDITGQCQIERGIRDV